jgi:hypothetical protein
MKRVERISNVLILVLTDVRPAAVTQRQDGRHIARSRVPTEVAAHEAA